MISPSSVVQLKTPSSDTNDESRNGVTDGGIDSFDRVGERAAGWAAGAASCGVRGRAAGDPSHAVHVPSPCERRITLAITSCTRPERDDISSEAISQCSLIHGTYPSSSAFALKLAIWVSWILYCPPKPFNMLLEGEMLTTVHVAPQL